MAISEGDTADPLLAAYLTASLPKLARFPSPACIRNLPQGTHGIELDLADYLLSQLGEPRLL